MKKRIAIQGYESSFHQMAARRFFGYKIDVIPCMTFKELIKISERAKKYDGAIMAIEKIVMHIMPGTASFKVYETYKKGL